MATIRAASIDDVDALGLITVTASLGTFIGQIPEEDLDLGWRPEDSATGWRATMSELPSSQFFLVADVGGQVAGFVWAGLSRTGPDDEGEINGLYVLPTRQRVGLGRLLVVHAVDRLRRCHAISSLLIGCIKENPSCGFYRHLGGIESFRRPNAVDNYQTEEVFFRWTDLAPLT